MAKCRSHQSKKEKKRIFHLLSSRHTYIYFIPFLDLIINFVGLFRVSSSSSSWIPIRSINSPTYLCNCESVEYLCSSAFCMMMNWPAFLSEKWPNLIYDTSLIGWQWFLLPLHSHTFFLGTYLHRLHFIIINIIISPFTHSPIRDFSLLSCHIHSCPDTLKKKAVQK